MARRYGIALALALATIAVYAPAVGFEFVDLDDNVYVTDNAEVREGLTFRALGWALTTGHASNWHPLTWLSHLTDVELYGLEPGGHHLTNLVFHVANVLLLFALLTGATGRVIPSALVAALFALHPLNVESVAWIAERKNLLSTLLGLLSSMAYVAYARRGGASRYFVTAVLLALGLMAKPMLVTLPFVFLLLDYWPLRRLAPRSGIAASESDGDPAARRSPARLVLEKIPFFVLVLLSSAVTYLVQRGGGAVVGTGGTLPLGSRLTNAVVSYARYLKKVFWPDDLAVLYLHPNQSGGVAWSAGQVVASLALLAIVSAAVLASRKRYAIVGWLWFLGTLVPVIGLVQVGDQAMADRYAYQPMVGLFIALVWVGADGLELVTRRRSVARMTAAIISLAILVALGTASRRQLRYWHDSIALFERGLVVSPTNPTLLFNLGTVHESKGRIDEAERQYRRAVEIKPDYDRAHFGLANALAAQGRSDEAVEHYRLALELQPRHAEAHYNLANELRDQGDLQGAIRHYLLALEIRPDLAGARNNLGTAYLTVDDPERAVDELGRLVESDPGMAEGHNNLGIALARSGRSARALEHFLEASRLDASSFTPLISAAWILATDADPSVRDPDEAVRLAERGVALAGGVQPAALDTLGAAYASAGRFDDAVRTAQEAARLAAGGGQERLAGRIRARIVLYRSGMPWVQRPRAEGSEAP